MLTSTLAVKRYQPTSPHVCQGQSGPATLLMALTSWAALDKSAKVEWNYLSQRRADKVVQRLEPIATQVLQPYQYGT